MRKILIPLLACFLSTAATLHAQVPRLVKITSPLTGKNNNQPESACDNNAGTFKLGTFKGQSNDISLDTIYLCAKDSIFINHDGNAILTGDPVPSTPPGVVWAFYNCAPKLTGPELNDLVQTPIVGQPYDTCLITTQTSPGVFSPVVASGTPEGDVWFFNDGSTLQNQFNMGQPVLLTFAPMTIDWFAQLTYESNQPGFPPGPCVNVNKDAAFSVYYLTPIRHSNFESPYENNDCVGKFIIDGGYPEADKSKIYDITITLDSDPTVKGLIRLPRIQLKDGASVVFSVPQPGTYTIQVEDGKSCGYSFKANMGACTPADNVKFIFPELTVAPNKSICVPITVENFNNMVGAVFSIEWDETVLNFTGIQNEHPELLPDFTAANLNVANIAQGNLGVVMLETDAGDFINIPNGQTLFEVCFDAIGAKDECSSLTITNNPTQVEASGAGNVQRAVSVDTGSVCIILEPLVIEFTQDTFCNGTASVTATATGGFAPYQVTIQQINPNGPVTTDQINLSGGSFTDTVSTSGSYKVCVIDNDGLGVPVCDTLMVDVSLLGAQLDLTKIPKCFGEQNGAVTANIILGSTQVTPGPNFSFNWLPATLAQNTNIQANVGSGTYSVTVTDKNSGCTAIASGTLPNPSRVDSGPVNLTPAACKGLDNGVINYTAEGGTPLPGNRYDFTWATAPTQSDPKGASSTVLNTNPLNLGSRAAGFYWLTITDANKCRFVDSFELDLLRTIELDKTITNATCSYRTDGAVNANTVATPPFANPNFTFAWAPTGTGTVTSTLTSTALANAAPGIYVLTATEVSGCKITDTIEIDGPDTLRLSPVDVKDPTCLSPNNGSIQVFARGGTGGPFNYTYNWSNSAPSAPQVSGLSTGSYSVTVVDVNGCRDSLAFSIKVPDPPQITGITQTQPRCGDDGCLEVNAPTGQTYEWFTISGVSVGMTAKLCGLPGDTFYVVVKDSVNCVARDTSDLTPVTPMTVFESMLEDPKCVGSEDGSVAVVIQGGMPNPSYIYNWSSTPPQTGSTLRGVSAGTYIVSVRDSKDCLITDTFELKDPPQITPNYVNFVPATCSDSCNGGVTVNVTYASTPPTNGSFTFEWEDGGTDSIRTNLCPGIHKVTITDIKNCVLVDSVNIASPPPVDTSALTSTTTTCFGDNDGSATVLGVGGNGGPYTYMWSNGSTTTTVSNLTPDTYTVIIKDRLGCSGVFSVDVMQPDSIIVTQDTTATKAITCFGNDDGVLGVTVTGGNPGLLSFNWLEGGVTPAGSKQVQDMLSAGSYDVLVTDVRGCTGSLLGLTLANPPAVLGDYNRWEPIRCNGEETIFSVATIAGGSGGPYRYSVDNGVPLEANATISLGGGEHVITYFDNLGCSFNDTINIDEPSPITVIFTPDEVEVELGDEYILNPILNIVPDSFIWNPSSILRQNGTLLNDTVYTFESEVLKLTVIDANGCTGSGEIVINIDANRNIYVPNAFKPGNSDGTNDFFNVFRGKGVELINYLRVYDRWGTLMYEQDNFLPEEDFQPSTGWDGRYNGKFVNPGVYIYILEARFLDGRVLLYRGDVTVIR